MNRCSPAVDYVQYYGCTAYFAEPRAGFTMRTADLKCPLDHDELAHQAVVEYLGGLIVATPTRHGRVGSHHRAATAAHRGHRARGGRRTLDYAP